MKPLHIGVKSKAMSEDEILMESMGRCLVEYSFYSESEFNNIKDLLGRQPYIKNSDIPLFDWSYADFVEAWKNKYMVKELYETQFSEHVVVPASGEAHNVTEFEDNIERTHETLQTQAPVMDESREDLHEDIFRMRGAEGTDLGNFLARPIVVYTANVDTTTVTFDVFSPWAELLKNASIREKVKHFRYIRAKVLIEAYFNASPKYYGKYMIACNWKNPAKAPNDGDFGQYDASFADNTLASQSLVTYISPDVDKVQLEIPFVYRSEYIDMLQPDPGSTGGGYLDGEAGLVYVRQMAFLNYAGDPGTESCDITITACMKDV
jgi:hypothetical protein